MEPFKVELFEVFFSGGQKFFFIKKEKNYLSDLSHDVRKPFSANETFNYFFFYITKSAAVTYAAL